MNFEYSDEQKMLQESISRFIQQDYDFYQRCDIVKTDTGFSEEHWQTFAELGWLSIPFSEEHGGYGGGVVDTMLVMEQLGRGLVVEPYFQNVLLFGGLLEAATTPNGELLAALIEGKCQGTFAYLERQSRFDLQQLATKASQDGEHFLISGEKTMVFNAPAADHIVVSARTEGDEGDAHGQTLFLLDAQTEGMSRTDYRLMDGQWASNIRFDNVRVDATAIVGELNQGYDVVNKVTRRCTLALCAEAVGILGKLNELTIEYTRGREQFGVAISSFQALQHRMVDMFMAYEQTKSLLYRAVCSESEGSASAVRDLHALKVLVDRSGRLIGEEAIQLHGGMGLTEEMAVGHYVRRLMMINTLFGNGDYHQDQFNSLSYAA
jgi:alkylation response protein AidB-like acyl-CoA dehydrogenase